MSRTILHLDLDAFFCAVAEKADRALKGKPFAVGGSPEGRGVVASCSYAARRYGVRSAMPMAQALRLCPQLIIVGSRHGEYGEWSERVMERLDALTPLVEQVSIDEAFLDITGAAELGEVIARRLQARIRTELGLPCSLGVAANKLVAKVASDFGKQLTETNDYPNAIHVVPPGSEAAFLAPLPVRRLRGVGPKTSAALESIGILTIGDLASAPANLIEREYGLNGRGMVRRAQGIDESQVVTGGEAKSVSSETTFSQDVADRDALWATLLSLSERVGRDLRRSGLTAKTIALKYRKPDFTTLTRQMTLQEATDLDGAIFRAARTLFQQVWKAGEAVRLLGVGASKLSEEAPQLTLWDQSSGRRSRLQETVDSLRDRFGSSAATWGRGMKGKEKNDEEST